MKLNRGSAFALGAVTAVALGSGTAYAATGSVLIGHANKSTHTTTVTNTTGTPLSLVAGRRAAPLAVSNSTKVARLNADLLDGLDSSKFALASGATVVKAGTTELVDIDSDGIPDGAVGTATCPSGTSLTSGGVVNTTAEATFIDAPSTSQARTWVGATLIGSSDTTDDLEVYAVCYSPRGSVPSGTTRLAARPTGGGLAGVIEDLRTLKAKR